MQFHKLVFSDGTVVTSGSEAQWAIVSVETNRSVNDGPTLKLGSVCAAVAKVALFAPADASLAVGSQAELWRGEQRLGSFTVTQIRRPSRNRLELTLHDAVISLDQDVTGWLQSLTGWPYTLSAFAGMVAGRCGLTLETADIPNASLPIGQFTAGIVTGRELMGWCAELAGCFCHATGEGTLRFGRYQPSGITVKPTGDAFYYLDSLAAAVSPVEEVVGVQVRSLEDDTLRPEYAQGANVYIIEGNPLSAGVDTAHLAVILEGIPKGYTVGTVTLPDSVAVDVGQTLQVFDGMGTVTLPVMELTAKKGRQTVSSTGKHRLDSPGSISAAARLLAQQLSIARQAVDAQTQADIFNKLTNNGAAQGIFLEDGQLYINASFLAAGIIDAAVVQVVNLIAERLCSLAGDSSLEIDGAQLQLKSGEQSTVLLSNACAGMPILYMYDSADGVVTNKCELSPHHFRLGGTDPAGVVYLSVSQGAAQLDIGGGIPKTLGWTYDSGLGKYVLTGS